jgi:hypothetical protein
MHSPNNDFNEEMHVLVYQITTKEDIEELELNDNEYTNVFSTYTTKARVNQLYSPVKVYLLFIHWTDNNNLYIL